MPPLLATDGKAAELTRLEALLSAQGAALLGWLARHPPTPDTVLAAAARLRASYPPDLVAAALTQHELRVRARPKFSRAREMFFSRAGLEQASAEVVSRHRASRFATAARVADLCCGIGGDLIALAVPGQPAGEAGTRGGRQVLAVDCHPLHLRIAEVNAGVYGAAAALRPVLADARDVSLDGLDAVFADPARRAGTRRLPAGVSEPPLGWCLGLAERIPAVAVKTAPGVSPDRFPRGCELEFIAVGRELKEATAWSPALATTARRATVLPGGHTLVGVPGGPVPVAEPGEFLLDPNPAVTRAGLVEDLARLTGCWKIDSRIALAATLRRLGAAAVDVRRRGLAGDVGELHRALRLPGGPATPGPPGSRRKPVPARRNHGQAPGPGSAGGARATLVMTRVRDQPWALVCVEPGSAG
jgi:16S rRNA G966 N2-methylase RsmD